MPLGKKARAIKKGTLKMILEASRESYPKEFAAILRSEEGTITEILLLPGTLSGGESALLRLHMLPIDLTAVGTVHSHPSEDFRPSEADLHLFQKFGYVHIITAYPYDEDSWAAWDFYGKAYKLEVLD